MVRVEGRLVGPWVGELARVWRGIAPGASDGRVAVDLSDVTFVGEAGKALLESMYAEGAKLKASGCVTRRLVDEIAQCCARAHPKQTVVNP